MAFEDDDIENGVQLATRIYQSGFVDEDSAGQCFATKQLSLI